MLPLPALITDYKNTTVLSMNIINDILSAVKFGHKPHDSSVHADIFGENSDINRSGNYQSVLVVLNLPNIELEITHGLRFGCD